VFPSDGSKTELIGHQKAPKRLHIKCKTWREKSRFGPGQQKVFKWAVSHDDEPELHTREEVLEPPSQSLDMDPARTH